jgi:hypothetical protein
MQGVARVTQIEVFGHDIIVTVLVHNNFNALSWSQFLELHNLEAIRKPELIKTAEVLSANPKALGGDFLLYCDMEPIDLTFGGQYQSI